MPDWQERITRESEPELRVEHELRYALVRGLVRDSALWCDLGCGNGVAAARALSGTPPRRTVLVDVDAGALEQSERELPLDDVVTVTADLSDPSDVAQVRATLLEHAAEGGGCITCFETVEHLDAFPPLVSMLSDLSESHGFTVVLSVPNDAFWAVENPHHKTMWGEGSFEELRRLLPAGHVALRQLPLLGSVVAGEDAEEHHKVDVTADGGGVPSHFLVAFGPRVEELATAAEIVQADLEEQRRWVRQREADLAYLNDLQEEVAKLRSEVQWMSNEFEDWRSYIHELEGKLGLPLSGEKPERPSE